MGLLIRQAIAVKYNLSIVTGQSFRCGSSCPFYWNIRYTMMLDKYIYPAIPRYRLVCGSKTLGALLSANSKEV